MFSIMRQKIPFVLLCLAAKMFFYRIIEQICYSRSYPFHVQFHGTAIWWLEQWALPSGAGVELADIKACTWIYESAHHGQAFGGYEHMDMVNHKAHAKNTDSHPSGLYWDNGVKYEEVLHRVEKVESGNCPLINMHDTVSTESSTFHILIDLVYGKSIRQCPICLLKKEKCDEICVFGDEKL